MSSPGYSASAFIRAYDELVELLEHLNAFDVTSALPVGYSIPQYRHAPGRIDPEGDAADDRTFWLDGFSRAPMLETGTASTRAEYTTALVVLLRGGALSLRDQMNRAAIEARLIARAIESKQEWSSGVQAVITGAAEVNPTENNETDMLLTIELSITVVEN